VSRVLVVCFSRSGRTRSLGTTLAACLRADFEAITEPADRAGVSGYLRSLADALFGRSVRIDPPQHNVTRYDVVIIGTPVWGTWLSSAHNARAARPRSSRT
jgi:flavodoxin